MPLAANADGANSAATVLRARGIYGSRIFALQGKSAATIVEEKAAFTLFLSGAYRTSLSGEAKANKKELTALSEKIMKTANAGGDAQADLKKFTATVMDQSGSMGYSFYQTLPGNTPGFKEGDSPAKKYKRVAPQACGEQARSARGVQRASVTAGSLC